MNLSWLDKSASETGFTLQRADDPAFTVNVASFPVSGTTPHSRYDIAIPYVDASASGSQYYYRVRAFSDDVYDHYLPTGVQTAMLVSPWSNTATLSPVPIAAVAPATISMGNQLVAVPGAPRSVTLTNNGTLTLNISGIILTGANPGDFSLTSTCGVSLAPGASCTTDIIFTPGSVGIRTASMDISTNDPLYPTVSVALSGNGITRIAGLNPGSLTFSNQTINVLSPPQTVSLTNTGTSPLAITSITFGGTNPGEFFRTTSCGASLPAGATCNINVYFKPLATGPPPHYLDGLFLRSSSCRSPL